MPSDSLCRPTIAVSDKEQARAFYGETAWPAITRREPCRGQVHERGVVFEDYDLPSVKDRGWRGAARSQPGGLVEGPERPTHSLASSLASPDTSFRGTHPWRRVSPPSVDRARTSGVG
jgi:hypothetical protein